MKSLLLLLALVGSTALAKPRDMVKELNTLGSNQAMAERAKAIDGENKIRVVQDRIVSRNLRLELGVSYDGVTGGDSYLTTNNVGYNLDFHIIPKLSIGARHYSAYSKLTSEGDRVFSEHAARRAAGDFNSLRPDVDYPLSSTLGTITFYPLYGKLNFFNLGVTQFDVYVLGAYGRMELSSGSSPTWAAGGGLGIWWAKHLSSRLEFRHQRYEDQIYTGKREQATTAFSFGIGLLI